MNSDIRHAVRLTTLFLVAGALLGAGIWTYWRLGLVVGLVGVLASVALVSYAGYDTYRFATTT